METRSPFGAPAPVLSFVRMTRTRTLALVERGSHARDIRVLRNFDFERAHARRLARVNGGAR
jgi:hypothetical protein